jgi:hypothetical protein
VIDEHAGVHSTLGELTKQNSHRVHKLLTIPKTTMTEEEEKLRNFYTSEIQPF